MPQFLLQQMVEAGPLLGEGLTCILSESTVQLAMIWNHVISYYRDPVGRGERDQHSAECDS